MRICCEIFEKYPKAEIGYLIAEVAIQKQDPYVEALKETLRPALQAQGIEATNFALHPALTRWREIYASDFGVKAKSYRSSIEALVRRIVTGKALWNIYNVVDLYNCCSVLSLLPMGGYDLDKVEGEIHIRFARAGETFQGLGEKRSVEVSPSQVVYADEKDVLCWLWNHKDAAKTCIDSTSKRIIFFVDAFDNVAAHTALQQLAHHLKAIGCVPLDHGILNQANPCLS